MPGKDGGITPLIFNLGLSGKLYAPAFQPMKSPR